ncbi:uncharacterized protein AB9W97_018845 [Spinachia spinachia]
MCTDYLLKQRDSNPRTVSTSPGNVAALRRLRLLAPRACGRAGDDRPGRAGAELQRGFEPLPRGLRSLSRTIDTRDRHPEGSEPRVSLCADSPLAVFWDDPGRVRLQVVLRCSDAQECEPYLRVGIAVQDVIGANEASAQSGHRDPGGEDGSGASELPEGGAAVDGENDVWHPSGGHRPRTLERNENREEDEDPIIERRYGARGKGVRGEFCPFGNRRDKRGSYVLDRMRHNVSLSLSESRVREGGLGLIWNVSAPCRLEAELRRCRRARVGGRCEEVTRKGHWKAGEFNVSSNPLLCIQIKPEGMTSYLEPQCPFTTSRCRWSLPIFVGLIRTCSAVLGAYLVQGVLKGYVEMVEGRGR